LAAKAKAEKEAVEANMNLQREVRAHTRIHTRTRWYRYMMASASVNDATFFTSLNVTEMAHRLRAFGTTN
jgi:hypothetical protein